MCGKERGQFMSALISNSVAQEMPGRGKLYSDKIQYSRVNIK